MAHAGSMRGTEVGFNPESGSWALIETTAAYAVFTYLAAELDGEYRKKAVTSAQ
jgi:hypothetical protein